jgi:hypothetical protein
MIRQLPAEYDDRAVEFAQMSQYPPFKTIRVRPAIRRGEERSRTSALKVTRRAAVQFYS